MDKSLLADATSTDDSPVSGYMLKEIARKKHSLFLCIAVARHLDLIFHRDVTSRGNYQQLPCVQSADRLLGISHQEEQPQREV